MEIEEISDDSHLAGCVQIEQVDSHHLSSQGDILVKDNSKVVGDFDHFYPVEQDLPAHVGHFKSVCLQQGGGLQEMRPWIEDVVESNDIQICEIEAKVDNILAKLELHLEDQSEKLSQESRVKLKLDFIDSNINLTNTVKDLQMVVKEVQKMSVSEEKEDVSLSSLDQVMFVLLSCRSVSEIETKVPEFR